MDPAVPHLQALFATLGLGLDAVNLIEVGARIGHDFLLRIQNAA
jgi:hypothetical protein